MAARGWFFARITVLCLALLIAASWAYSVRKARGARKSWDATLSVAVVLLSNQPLPEGAVKRFASGLPSLAAQLTAELSRHRPGAPAPFAFELVGPLEVANQPPWPEGVDIVSRISDAYHLHRYLSSLHQRAQLEVRAFDVRIYLWAEPAVGEAQLAEGIAAQGGEIGMVRASLDERDATLPLLALSHELLHCLGATDKYDAAGHAVEPGGLADPQRQPKYPQAHAEIMAGEVATSPGAGRLPDSLDELRVGERTAAEIGWRELNAPPY